MRIAINGFGRIGRNFLRTILSNKQALQKLDVVAINVGPASLENVAHMFKYDTLMGTFSGEVKRDGTTLIVDGKHITLLQALDPLKINWKQYDIDWVVDCSGHFTSREGAQKHIDAGARAVLISAPAKGEDISIIPGVNGDQYDAKKHKIVSLGSCTTNAIVPMLKVLNDAFGVESGFMTTIHAYTNSQVLLDVEDSDVRRARAAALNIIPTTTGAMKMVEKIMPSLEGKIKGMAMRVPVAIVSLIDLVIVAQKPLSVEQINAAFKKASASSMKGIVDLSMEPLVSSDYRGTHYSVVIDGLLTQVHNNMAQVFGWYDNEWGYSERLRDFLMDIA